MHFTMEIFDKTTNKMVKIRDFQQTDSIMMIICMRCEQRQHQQQQQQQKKKSEQHGNLNALHLPLNAIRN